MFNQKQLPAGKPRAAARDPNSIPPLNPSEFLLLVFKLTSSPSVVNLPPVSHGKLLASFTSSVHSDDKYTLEWPLN